MNIVRVIGLTGGIASGKSTVAAMLRDAGAAIVDADQLARQVVEPGQPALAAIVDRFGADVLAADGTLDRKQLGALVFGDADARRALEAITHPRIRAASQQAIASLVAQGVPLVIYEAALIVEKRVHEEPWMSGLIVVTVPPAEQIRRLMARDGITEEAARSRMDAQLPLADKVAAADHVIDNSGSPADTRRQVNELWQRLLELDEDAPTHEVVLLTGFPGFLTRRMAEKLLAGDDTARVYFLVPGEWVEDAEHYLATLSPDQSARSAIAVGDPSGIDLALSGGEYLHLTREITTVHHIAASDPGESSLEYAHRTDVVGTASIVEFAGECRRLRRLCHWSTARVAGKRQGIVLEDELDEGQGFYTLHERTRFKAEKLAERAKRDLPVTIFRPGVVIRDGDHGGDGTYPKRALVTGSARQPRLHLPGGGNAPFNVVPVDYVIDAAYALSRDERAAGKTFHLTDPQPLSARRVRDLVADHRGSKPLGRLVRSAVTSLVRKRPGLERLARGPLALMDTLDHHVFYNCRQAEELLADKGIRCPSFDSYVDALVDDAGGQSTPGSVSADDEPDSLD